MRPELLHTIFMTTVTVTMMTSLTACTGQAILPALNADRQVPPDAVVLSPNERITLNAFTAKRTEYFCSNGTTLECERFSFKLRCYCPRIQP